MIPLHMLAQQFARLLLVYPRYVLDCLLLRSALELVHNLGPGSFINVFNRGGEEANRFHMREEIFQLNFFIGQLSS